MVWFLKGSKIEIIASGNKSKEILKEIVESVRESLNSEQTRLNALKIGRDITEE